MVKNLLFLPIWIVLFFLAPMEGIGQTCPTSVGLSADPGTTVCEGTPITFTANTSEGSGLSFQWEINGSIVGNQSNSYTLQNPQQGQQIKVTVLSNDSNCESRTSSSLVVNTKKTPTVGITPNKTTICPGESVTFSASPTNQGASPTYEWFVNNTSVQNSSSSSLINPSGLQQGSNTIKVIMTSSLTCVTTDKAEKTIGYEVKPIATIVATTATGVETCTGVAITPIKFSIGGGGTGATVSGLPSGVSGSYSGGVYTISGTPTTAGTFNFSVNTTGTCEQTSDTGTITVNPNATLSLTSGNKTQTLCASDGVADAQITPITYGIGETGNGATVTGLPSGITGSYSNKIFTIEGSSSVTGTHNFTVTANGTCGNSSPLTGSITITKNQDPSVSISSSDSDNNICDGASVTFTATPVNGGSSPAYQWKINGNNVGSNSNTFTTSSLNDGQTVTVTMTSNETCITKYTATSNGISTTVNPNLEPSVSIDPSDTDFCAGDEVIYTAVPVNGGTSPTYQWKIGSSIVGTGESFSSDSITDGQSITVTLTSSETCVTSATAVSDPVITSVNENLIPSINIVSNDDNNIICSGNSISFTATAANGGTTPQYQWQINGSASGNITSANSFNPTNIADGDRVSVVLISSEECLVENNVVSNKIEVQVDQDITTQVPTWNNTDPIHNPTAICPSVSGLKYKIAPISGATSYDWSLPAGWSITGGAGTEEITVTASVNASAGNVTVNGRTECGASQSISLSVTTGTAAHVDAGPDQVVCPGTTEINLNGEIGGVIAQKKDWNWSDNGAGGTFKAVQGNDLESTYTIPSSLRNGGTITIRIQSVKPAGNCDIKTDEMVLTILSAAAITQPTNNNQTVCINSEIDVISFSISGAGTGATAMGLPEGVVGNFADGIFTLSGTPTESGTFNYTVTTTGECTNVARTGTLTVNPRPTFTQPEEIFVCAGENTSAISFGGSSVSGTTYDWMNDNTSIGLAANGSGDIASFKVTNSTDAPISANIIVTPSANNCEGPPREFKITVYPTATMDDPIDIEVCSGTEISTINFAGSSVTGTSYKWVNDNTAIGLGASGTGNIPAFSTENNTTAPLTANIVVTPLANGCEGTPQEFTITVNPISSFTTPGDIAICNGEMVEEISFTGATVEETSFNWEIDNINIGLAQSGSGKLPSFNAVNNTTEAIIATVTVTAFANNCEGSSGSFTITVKPTPEVENPQTIILCNGENFPGYQFSGSVEGTTYSWINNNTSMGLGANGSGSIPVFTATNDTDDPLTAVISVIPSANDCEGNVEEFEIIVNPSSKIDAGDDQVICSNGTATMNATISGGATNGEWSSSGSGTFSGNSTTAVYTPSDTDALNGLVTLTFTTNDPEGPCGAASDSVELIINAEVVITTQPENTGVCSTQPSELTVIASGDHLSYEWRRSDGENITNSNGIYSSTLSFNNTTSTNSGEYYVVVRGEDACNDEVNPVESSRVTINVDENIVIDEPSAEVPICGDGFSEATMKFIAHANNSPLSFTWFKDGIEVDEMDSKINITEAFINSDGKYEGTLSISGVTVDYNGDYYVEITGPEEFTCSTAVTNPFQLRLNEMPANPEVEDLVVCQNETPPAFTVNVGTNLKWYMTENDSDHITNDAGQPTAPVPPTNEPGNFYYWVTQQPEACESEKVQVKVTVKEKPAVPETEEIAFYCLKDTAVALIATGAENSTLNWYDSEGEVLSGAPTPDTENAGDTTYFVSQTPNDGFGCESERAEITVTVYPLPVVTAQATEKIICLESPAQLTATGGVSYLWFDGEVEIGDQASISHTPDEPGDYTFTVLVTDENGCQNTAEVNVQVDEKTVAGTITGPESVCVSSPTGTFNLTGYTGDILSWESSEDGGDNWTAIANTTENLEFSNLSTTTIFRAVVQNGVCEKIETNEIEVTIAPLPAGGELAFNGNGRVFTICENPVGNYAMDLNLTDKVGEVVRWGYRSWNANTYTDLYIGGELFTGTTLTAAQIQALGFNETTVFQVEVRSGVCSPDALSKTAILSVIPSDITPSPVTVDPGVVCLGEEVTLNSETGYETGGTVLDQGAFDNASITSHGWRIRRNNNNTDLGFDTDANNTVFDRWKRGTPREFTTARIAYPYSTRGVLFDTGIEDGNKGFALVSGNNSSTMETPVFTIGSMDQAILTFDQAYVLTPGASLKVEISTDGGNSYTSLYSEGIPANASGETKDGIQSGNFGSFGTGTVETTPENKISIDLGDYMGRPNLRIRFNYIGVRSGDIWAIDNIDIPEGPNGITMEWRDYTNPDLPEGILIGNNNSEKYTPTEVGLNIFEIKTKLVYNSNGDACEVEENAQRIEVFVFDKYTTSVTAEYGSCGVFEAKLTAKILNASGVEISTVANGEIVPTPDGYVGEWKIEGPEGYQLVDPNPADNVPAINDPLATLATNSTGNYIVSWSLIPTARNAAGELYANPEACPPVETQADVIIEGCTALDFDGSNDRVLIDHAYADVLSIEAWIRPKETGGTIISGPNFNITTPADVVPNSRWYHIAVSNGKLYIDGIERSNLTLGNSAGTKTVIGAEFINGEATNFFHGWIEEVRIWKKALTVDQIRFMMNQRLIDNGAQMGEKIPMEVPGGLTYTDLSGYYRLISANPDPAGLVSFDSALLPVNGETPNLANAAIPGRLVNMETNQENTAPLPYFSTNPGAWENDGTWARPEVWDPPHTGSIEWNIANISHDINSGSKDITVLGLLSDTQNKLLEIAAPGNKDENNSGQMLRVTHYLLLNGNIDLVGESQLVQDEGSILDESSAGWLERDQQGTRSSFNYNYWSSPVSLQGQSNNSTYTIAQVLRDGTNSNSPGNISFGAGHQAADGARTNPITISEYWLWRFNGTSDVYEEWIHIGSSGTLQTGEGFTMKGTDGNADIAIRQNYVFKGKPHNGDFTLSVGMDKNYLIGNPYPSAMDAREFILDNLNGDDVIGARNTQNIFNGVVYFWDHFAGHTHILREYVGGYAALTLAGAVPAVSIDERINANDAEGTKTPQQYIPVGQGFFINTGLEITSDGEAGNGISVDAGNIEFKNSQREGVRESSSNSIFLKPIYPSKKTTKASDERAKIRLRFDSPKGYHRQILVAADPITTDNVDLGYDAPLIEYNLDDMYWIINRREYVIQAVPDFGKERILPLGVQLEEKGNFTIAIDSRENLGEDHKIYLQDKLRDSIHDFKDGPYKEESESGFIDDRFSIIFHKKEIPVPGTGEEEEEEEESIFDAITIAFKHSSRELKVYNPDLINISRIVLFDLTGKKVQEFSDIATEKEVTLPVVQFPSSVYIVKLFSDKRTHNKKILMK